MSHPSTLRRLSFEQLEDRRVLSLVIATAAVSAEHGDDLLLSAEAKGGGGGKGKVSGPEIDLPTVVLHELGHSLGLQHSTSASCGKAGQPVMCPYYLGPAFQLHTEDMTKIHTLYPNSSEVVNPDDDRWDDPDITFSFMPDGTSIEQGGRNGSELFKVMQAAIGADWQSVFRQALDMWAAASGDVLTFTEVADDGSPFNFTGNGTGQGDEGVGDIRFGSHKFDGPGGVLAHAYFPPPNGATAAGDAHFAKEENWKNLSGVALSLSAAPGAGSELATAPGHRVGLLGMPAARFDAAIFSASQLAAMPWSIEPGASEGTDSLADQNVDRADPREAPPEPSPLAAFTSFAPASVSSELSETISPDAAQADGSRADVDEALLSWLAGEALLPAIPCAPVE